ANALAAAGLTVGDLASVIQAGNRNDGAGRIVTGEEALIVRATGAIGNVDDLAAVVVRAGPGGIVRVGDVAAVRIGALTRYGAVTRDGR
ncbi:efflux RND transporter permease subunit, partial [Acinetobacter baumannii]